MPIKIIFEEMRMNLSNKNDLMDDRWFRNFWEHYERSSAWLRSSSQAVQRLKLNRSCKRPEEPFSRLSSPLVLSSVYGSNQFEMGSRGSYSVKTKEISSSEKAETDVDDDADEELTPEMADFFKKTLEHREKS